MLLAQTNALQRALSACAKFLHIPSKSKNPAGTAPPPLTPHMLRDIGLDPGDEARLKHQWPSQTTRHPYL